MESTGDFPIVTLSVDNVPGAKLKYSLVVNHTIIELKGWLHYRDQLRSFKHVFKVHFVRVGLHGVDRDQ